MSKEPKKYSRIHLFIRSLLFSIFSITSIIVYGTFLGICFVFPLSIRYALLRFYVRFYLWVLKKLCHIDYQVEGLEYVRQTKIGVCLCKHQSTWETVLLPLIFHDPAIIIKRELLWIPFFGWGLAASNPISINRNKTKTAMQQVIEKGKQYLAQGRWVVLFPEGTRVAYGKVGKYRLGGARLAKATGYPVIPIAHNAGKYWPRRKFIKNPGTVRVIIGPPIDSTNKTPEEILHLTKEWIESTMARI